MPKKSPVLRHEQFSTIIRRKRVPWRFFKSLTSNVIYLSATPLKLVIELNKTSTRNQQTVSAIFQNWNGKLLSQQIHVNIPSPIHLTIDVAKARDFPKAKWFRTKYINKNVERDKINRYYCHACDGHRYSRDSIKSTLTPIGWHYFGIQSDQCVEISVHTANGRNRGASPKYEIRS